MKFFDDKLNKSENSVNYWIVMIILIIVLKSKTENFVKPKTIKDYNSIVQSNDCLLCGTPNKLNGADMISYIYFNNNTFNIAHTGLKDYCTADGDFYELCDTINVPDYELSASNLTHKYSPFNINGKYREHSDWGFNIFMFESPFDKHGTVGKIQRYESQFSYGKISKRNYSFADTNYLITILCQKCFEKVYPITRNVNGFFYDFQTSDVYSLPVHETNLYVREYVIDFIFVSNSDVVFVLRYKNS